MNKRFLVTLLAGVVGLSLTAGAVATTIEQSDMIDTTLLEEWPEDSHTHTSGETRQFYTIAVEYSARGDSFIANAVLSTNIGADWKSGPFAYTSTASIPMKTLGGSPKISHTIQDGKKYKTITQDYIVYVETRLTRLGTPPASISKAKRYQFTLSVAVPE